MNHHLHLVNPSPLPLPSLPSTGRCGSGRGHVWEPRQDELLQSAGLHQGHCQQPEHRRPLPFERWPGDVRRRRLSEVPPERLHDRRGHPVSHELPVQGRKYQHCAGTAGMCNIYIYPICFSVSSVLCLFYSGNNTIIECNIMKFFLAVTYFFS